MSNELYLLTEADVHELHSNLAGVLRCAGLKDGPVFDQTVADLFTIASSSIDRERAHEEKRRTTIREVK